MKELERVRLAEEAALTCSATNPCHTAVTEDSALALLSSRDVSANYIDELASNRGLLRSRKVMLAIARHVHTPRHISIPLVRQLFTFELMEVALTPVVPADIKLLAEQCLVGKLASTTIGERLTLAKRGSTRVAAALLADPDGRVRDAALNSPRMTETFVVAALMKPGSPASLITAVKRHVRWAPRVEVRRALESLSTPHLRQSRQAPARTTRKTRIESGSSSGSNGNPR